MGRAVLGSGLRRRELQAIPRNYWLDLLLQKMATLKCAFLLFTLAYTCHAKWMWKEDYPIRDGPPRRHIPSRYEVIGRIEGGDEPPHRHRIPSRLEVIGRYDALENDPGNDCQDLLKHCGTMKRYCESDDIITGAVNGEIVYGTAAKVCRNTCGKC